MSEVHVEREGSVAIVVIDNPPVNASSHAVRQGLLLAIRQVDGDETVTAVVLAGEGRAFMGGADIREFDTPPLDPQLPQVIAAIMDSSRPWVAAIQGAALGGGFELALACDVRVAGPDAIVGLPEVTLGIMPGAGGTQHLPRLVGVARAIELICAGHRLNAQEALDARIVDHLAGADVRAAAVTLAAATPAKRRIRDLPVPSADPEAVAVAEEAARAAHPARQVVAAIESIKRAATMPYRDAMARERQVFMELRASPEAAELRRKFFAARVAAKDAPR